MYFGFLVAMNPNLVLNYLKNMKNMTHYFYQNYYYDSFKLKLIHFLANTSQQLNT